MQNNKMIAVAIVISTIIGGALKCILEKNTSNEKLLTAILVVLAAIGLMIITDCNIRRVAYLGIATVTIIVGAVSMSGCGKTQIDDGDSTQMYKANVIQEDSNTASFHTADRAHEVNTEYQQEVERLDSEQPETGLEQQVQDAIVEKFSKYGITGVITFSNKNFNSATEFEMLGHNDTTTLTIIGYGNTETGEVYAEYAGSENGSELVPLVGIDKLQGKASDIEELLYSCGFSIGDIGTIDEVAGTRVYVSINGEQHIVDTLYNTVDGKTEDGWVNGESVEVTTTETEEQ